jgi:hypothetical protein
MTLDGDRGAYLYAAAYSQWGDTAAGINWLKKSGAAARPFIVDFEGRLAPRSNPKPA